jgi:transcriptional antiterminator RfaH
MQSILRWLLIFTKPAAERTAQANLERQGYHVYYPRLLLPALRRGRWVDRIVPLFPRYLFVRIDSKSQSMGPLRSTIGVSSVVRFGQDAAIVPEGIVESLQGWADPSSGLHRLTSRRPLKAGTRVSVIAGAFEGLDGIFEREIGEDRAIILLEVLGRRTPVSVPSVCVVPAIA